jgi:hypothetical protein
VQRRWCVEYGVSLTLKATGREASTNPSSFLAPCVSLDTELEECVGGLVLNPVPPTQGLYDSTRQPAPATTRKGDVLKPEVAWNVHHNQPHSSLPSNHDVPSSYLDPLLLAGSWIDHLTDVPSIEAETIDICIPAGEPIADSPVNQATPSKSANVRRQRTKIKAEQKKLLLDRFILEEYPSTEEFTAIASLTRLEYSTVKYWFENRRRQEKRSKNKRKSRSGFLIGKKKC